MNESTPVQSKPRLLFFQYRYDKRLPAFLPTQAREQIKCLSQFFHVTTVNDNCDYQQVCDRYEPDLALFESGVSFGTCTRPQIRNIWACPRVPKLGFLNCDGFSEHRARVLSDMDHWGINTFFAIATTATDYTPAIANNLFFWPNFVDPETFHNYDLPRSIPVLFTGNTNGLYPWRKRIMRMVARHYPSLICPHPGYEPKKKNEMGVWVGEQYARMLNASYFVPACGTVAREVVRKHFEIPACQSCLVTDESNGLKAAGFADMINCVFADEHNVLDKLAYLFEHLDELHAITRAGYELVHSQHTLHSRDQLLQWFRLFTNLRSQETIVHPGPFEPLCVVNKSVAVEHTPWHSDGLHVALLRQAEKQLWSGKYGEAESSYLKVLNYYRFMPEPQLGLALCNLYRGNAKTALAWIMTPLQCTLAEFKSFDPDPVEWSYFIIALLCDGKVEEASKRANQFSWLRHPELDRTRLLTSVLKHGTRAAPLSIGDALPARTSIHLLPCRTRQEWAQQISLMLTRCGQYRLVETLTAWMSEAIDPTCEHVGDRSMRAKHWDARAGLRNNERRNERNAAVRVFNRRVLYSRLTAAVKGSLRMLLHGLEANWGLRLPYRISKRRQDEFYRVIQELAREQEINSVLILGATPDRGCTEALLAGVRENKNKLFVSCISLSKGEDQSPKRSHSLERWDTLPSVTSDTVASQVQKAINDVKREHEIDAFDIVLVDGSEVRQLAPDALQQEISCAQFVVLEDLNTVHNNRVYSSLLSTSGYNLIGDDVELRDGYAVFERQGTAQNDVDGNPWSASLEQSERQATS